MSETDKLGRTTRVALKGALWSGVGQWGMSLITLLTLSINARLLGPEIYGIQAIAAAIVGFGNIIVSGALVEALTQRQNLTTQERHAGFWISLPIGLVLFGAFWIASLGMHGPVAAILPLSAVAIPLNACAAAPVALLMRDLRYKALSTVELISTALACATGVSLALTGHGVYSLVWMELTRVAARCVGAYWATAYRPGPVPDLATLWSVARFGLGGLGVSLVGLTDRQVPKLAIGYWLGNEAVGVFVIAWRMYETFSRIVLGPLGAVAMSITARLQDDPTTLRRLLFRSMRFAVTLAAPGFLGLAAISPVLVPAVFGDQWNAAILPAQIMMLMGVRNAASAHTTSVLRGVGHTRAPLTIQLIGLGITLALTPVMVPLGVAAAATLMLLRSLMTWPIGAHYLRKAITISYGDQVRAGAPSMVASIIMALIVWAWVIWARDELGLWATTISGVLIGILAYVSLLWLVAKDMMDDVQIQARQMLRLRSGTF